MVLWKANDVNGNIVYPDTTGLRAYCPTCHGEVISVCPKLNIVKHWRHKRDMDCDTWDNPHDSLSLWHRNWQKLVIPEKSEVTIGEHRADMQGNNDIVLEIQHSTEISIDNIRVREEYYKNMVWVLDSSTFFEDWNYNCYVPQGRNEIIYQIDKRIRKIRHYTKPLYVHLPCGALARIKSINEDTVTLEITHWKDFVDQYLSNVLSIEYPSLCPPNPYYGQTINNIKCGYDYPDCLFQMHFINHRITADKYQDENKKALYTSAGLGSDIKIPLAIISEEPLEIPEAADQPFTI